MARWRLLVGLATAVVIVASAMVIRPADNEVASPVVTVAASSTPVPSVIRSEPAWEYLESQARVIVSDMYGVANDDALLRWGRSEIEATIFALLLAITAKPDEDRTAQEKEAYRVLQLRVRTDAVRSAEEARAEYGRWYADPCGYSPPRGVEYSRPACTRHGSWYGGIKPPPTDFFLGVGGLKAASWLEEAPGAGGRLEAAILAIGVLGATAVPATVAGLVAAGLISQSVAKSFASAIAPYALPKVVKLGYLGITGTAAKAALGVGLAAGILAIILVAATMLTIEIIRMVEAAKVLPALDANLRAARELPDISDLLEEDTGALRVFNAFYPATLDWSLGAGHSLPVIPGDSVEFRPAAGDGHQFVTTDAVTGEVRGDGLTFTTYDLDDRVQTSYIEDGYFVTTKGTTTTRSLSLIHAQGSAGGAVRSYPGGFVPTLLDAEHLVPQICEERSALCEPGPSFLTFTPLPGRAAGMANVTVVPNRPPELGFEVSDRHTTEGTEIVFSAEETTDPDGDAITYEWTFPRPPGRAALLADPSSMTERRVGPRQSYTFVDDGTFPVTLTATDEHGLSESITVPITVDNVAPDLILSPVPPASRGFASRLTGVWSDAGTNDSHTVHIAWGDGTSTSGVHPTRELVYPPAPFRDLPDGTRSMNPTHVYAAPGTYTITVTVTDDDGASVVRTVTATVGVFDVPADASAPGTPSWVGSTVQDTGLRLSFSTVDDGGAPILRWEYHLEGDMEPVGGVEQPRWQTVTEHATFWVRIAGLGQAAVDQGVRLRPVNAIGAGPASPKASVPTVLSLHPPVPVVDTLPSAVVDEGAPMLLLNASASVAVPPPIPNRSNFIVDYWWDIDGDGVIDVTGPVAAISTQDDFGGTVRLQVIDDFGVMAESFYDVTVLNVAPRLDGLASSLTVPRGEPMTLTATIVDPSPVDTHEVTIDWGDGSGPRAVAVDGREVSVDHVYASNGPRTIILRTVDDDGGVDVQVVHVLVEGVPSSPLNVWGWWPEPEVIEVHWDAPATGDATHYIVEIRLDDEVVHRAETTELELLWDGAELLSTYDIEVQACSDQGCTPRAEAGSAAVQTGTVERGVLRELHLDHPVEAAYTERIELVTTLVDAPGATGEVEFISGGEVLGKVPLDEDGIARLVVSDLGLGRRDVTAVYSGDEVYAGAVATAEVVVVRPTRTRVEVGVDRPSLAGKPIPVVVRVRPVAPGDPDAPVTGKVLLALFRAGAGPRDGTTDDGLVEEVDLGPDGSARWSPTLSEGEWTVSAAYLGDEGFETSDLGVPLALSVVVETPDPDPNDPDPSDPGPNDPDPSDPGPEPDPDPSGPGVSPTRPSGPSDVDGPRTPGRSWTGPLARTGLDSPGWLIGLAALLVLAGWALTASVRSRRRSAPG